MTGQLFLTLFGVAFKLPAIAFPLLDNPPRLTSRITHTCSYIQTLEHMYANTACKIILAYIMVCLAQPEVYLYIMFSFK